jgi:hypothetical protein
LHIFQPKFFLGSQAKPRDWWWAAQRLFDRKSGRQIMPTRVQFFSLPLSELILFQRKLLKINDLNLMDNGINFAFIASAG